MIAAQPFHFDSSLPVMWTLLPISGLFMLALLRGHQAIPNATVAPSRTAIAMVSENLRLLFRRSVEPRRTAFEWAPVTSEEAPADTANNKIRTIKSALVADRKA